MRKCPHCGISLITMELTRKVGCSFCYNFFETEIRAIKGGLEFSDSLLVSPVEHKETLKRSLQKAVEKEEYEEAARIRDRLNAVELDVDSYPNK